AASPNTVSALRIGQETTVQTLLLIRDDNPVLYGFGTADEREIFEIMMTVSGIGPRIAWRYCLYSSRIKFGAILASKMTKLLLRFRELGQSLPGALFLSFLANLFRAKKRGQRQKPSRSIQFRKNKYSKLSLGLAGSKRMLTEKLYE